MPDDGWRREERGADHDTFAAKGTPGERRGGRDHE